MTLRFKLRRLWIIHFSWKELFLYGAMLLDAWAQFPRWLPEIAGLCVLLAFHPASISLGEPPILRRYFALIPFRRLTLTTIAPTISKDDWCDDPPDGIELEENYISCDHAEDVAAWIRENWVRAKTLASARVVENSKV